MEIDVRIAKKIEDIYHRTKANCSFYKENNDKLGLLNEIGCLRGIVYCMEAAGMNVRNTEVGELCRAALDIRIRKEEA